MCADLIEWKKTSKGEIYAKTSLPIFFLYFDQFMYTVHSVQYTKSTSFVEFFFFSYEEFILGIKFSFIHEKIPYTLYSRIVCIVLYVIFINPSE